MLGIDAPNVRRRRLRHHETLLSHLIDMLLEDERCDAKGVGQAVSGDAEIRKVREPGYHALAAIDVNGNVRLLQYSPLPLLTKLPRIAMREVHDEPLSLKA